jgi:hypothetical protein
VLCASAESGLLAALASPRRAEEAAETAGMPVEIASPVLEVLIVLGFARRSGDRYEAVEGLQPMLTDEAMGQLLANLRTTSAEPRARRWRQELPGLADPLAGRSDAAAKAETSADPQGFQSTRWGRPSR